MNPFPAFFARAAAAFASVLLLSGCLPSEPAGSRDSEPAYAAAVAAAGITLTSPPPSRGFWVNNDEVALNVTVSDPALFHKVIFYKNGAWLREVNGADGQAVYSMKYQETVPGGYTYSAVAYDLNGNRHASQIQVWVWFRFQDFGSYPINDLSGLNHQIPISAGAGKIRDVRIALGITHTWVGDLALTCYHSYNGINSPTVNLAYRLGGSGDNYGHTTFRDDASTSILNAAPPFSGIFRPQESLLGKLWGLPATGYFYVTVKDLASGDFGTWNWLEVYIKIGP